MAKMTEYERKRQENIERNEQMLAALRVHSVAQDLRSTSKKLKSQTKRLKTPKEPKPAFIRRSLRIRRTLPSFNATITGCPNSKELLLSFAETHIKNPQNVSYTLYIDKIKGLRNIASKVDLKCHMPEYKLENLKLDYKHISKTTPSGTTCLEFFPCRERAIVVSGDNNGHLSLWDVLYNAEEGDYSGLHVFRPHASRITGIAVKPFSIAEVISCSYDGFICAMDIEKEVFNMVYNSVDNLSAVCTTPFSDQSLYFAEGHGEMKMLDWRVRSVPHSYSLHEKRINSIDFNPQKPYMVSTSSDDGTARVFDLRNMKTSNNENVVAMQHRKIVYCAHFSPSGNYLATTSGDKSVGLLSGLDSETFVVTSVYNPQSDFRSTWGWDDQYLFVGNNDGGLNAYCTATKETTTLKGPFRAGASARLARHPFCFGMLASGGRGGQVYIWQNSKELLHSDNGV